jgi:hypothetical protein
MYARFLRAYEDVGLIYTPIRVDTVEFCEYGNETKHFYIPLEKLSAFQEVTHSMKSDGYML